MKNSKRHSIIPLYWNDSDQWMNTFPALECKRDTGNMGKNIDVIAGIFDETMLEFRGCDGTEISREPFCVAVSIHHRLAKKEKITLDDQWMNTFPALECQ